VPELSKPAPTPYSIHVTYPVDLKPWISAIADCASVNPGMAVYFTQSPGTQTAEFSDQISLELGEPQEVDPSSYLLQLGVEQVVVIVNQKNPRNEFTQEELQAIFSGQTATWNTSPDQPVQVWVLPAGDPARLGFDAAVMPNQPLAPDARLAPDPGAMLEAVAGDENSIGYLPASTITSADPTLAGKVKRVQLGEALAESLTQPVIAVTASEPEGLTRQLVICLQEAVP